jgi:hypothetical protein
MINVLFVCWLIGGIVTIICRLYEICEYKKHTKHDEERRDEI